MKQTQILDKMKSRFAQPGSSYRDTYHLKNVETNLFFKPYEGLDQKADSIRSSAAMIYNTIGPNHIVFDGKTYSTIEYEKKLPVLNNRPSAQLDVSMVSNDESEKVFIEAKCLEWLDRPKSLKDAYLSKENFPKEVTNVCSSFINSFNCLLSSPQMKTPNDERSILPFYERYDAIQMNIHILGIYNHCVREGDNIPKKVRLLNIVWDYAEAEEYRTEEKEGKEYVAFANVTFRNLFKQIGVDFSVEYVPYSEFLKRVDWSHDMEHRNYLKRYELQ